MRARTGGDARGLRLNLFNVYGPADDKAQTGDLLAMVLECAESSGKDACFMLGDINLDLTGHMLESGLDWAGWVDVFGGQGPTCQGTSSNYTNIDYVLNGPRCL